MTWYEAKGILEAVFDRLSLTVSYEKYAEDARFHPGRTASLWIGKQRLGIFGQLHPQLRQQKGLIETVYAFEIQFPILLATLSDSAKIPHVYRSILPIRGQREISPSLFPQIYP